MKKNLFIRNVDSELLDRLSRQAKDKNLSRNQFILETLAQADPLESYRKLYAEQTHQQAQNTKVLQEVTSKQDRILEILTEYDF